MLKLSYPQCVYEILFHYLYVSAAALQDIAVHVYARYYTLLLLCVDQIFDIILYARAWYRFKQNLLIYYGFNCSSLVTVKHSCFYITLDVVFLYNNNFI